MTMRCRWLLKAWKGEIESGCEKLRSLQRTTETVSTRAGHGNATTLVDKLNRVSDEMNALLASTAARQVAHSHGVTPATFCLRAILSPRHFVARKIAVRSCCACC